MQGMVVKRETQPFIQWKELESMKKMFSELKNKDRELENTLSQFSN